MFGYKRNLLTAALLAGSLLLGYGTCAQAVSEAARLRLEANRSLPVQSDQIPDWPKGPTVGAAAAILIEAQTGVVLYAKNIHQQEYPASTTKILTALIASERCRMDEIVSFSREAVFDTPRNSSHIAMDVGQELTMEQCLNAILIRSANEVSFAVAEHIAGTPDWQVFAEVMNKRAKELGCLNSNFVNPNGLPDDAHYTTPYDLAMIGRGFFANELLCKITLSKRIDFPPTDKLPQGKLENNHMQIIPGGTYAYPYLVGCKTGYTEAARSCLVSSAEKNGLRLICVVMRDEAPYQYEDTIALFEYGFSNFEKVNVAQAETKYDIADTGLFYSDNDIFGSSRPFLSLDKDGFILLPRTLSLQDVQSSISYGAAQEDQAALISYSYQGVALGTVGVSFSAGQEKDSFFADAPETDNAGETGTADGNGTANGKDTASGKDTANGKDAAGGKDTADRKEGSVVFIDVSTLLIGLGVLAGMAFLWLTARIILRNYNLSFRGGRLRRRRRRRKRGRRWGD